MGNELARDGWERVWAIAQRPLALVAAGLMVLGAVEVRENYDAQDTPTEQLGQPLLTPQIEAPPFTIVPEIAVPEIPIKSGLFKEGGLQFDNNESLGVRCGSSSSGAAPIPQEGRWRRDLYTGTKNLESLAPDESFIFFGQETGRTSTTRQLKEGLVLGHNRSTGKYRLLTFQVREINDEGSLRDLLSLAPPAAALAKQFVEIPIAALNQGVAFSYKNITVFIRIDNSHESGLPVSVTIRCK